MPPIRSLWMSFVVTVSPIAAAPDGPINDLALTGELRPGVLRGYLDGAHGFDSAMLLEPPPPAGTALDRSDRAHSLALRRAASADEVERARRDTISGAAGVLLAFSDTLAFTPSASSTAHPAKQLVRGSIEECDGAVAQIVSPGSMVATSPGARGSRLTRRR
jgi:hypothetical protein